jgi:hypothetical protein
MDPFEDQTPNPVPPGADRQEPPLFDLARPWISEAEDDRLTRPEKSLGSSTSIVKRAFMLVLFTAAFACLVLLLIPGLRFMWEFSQWAYEEMGGVFP